MNTNSTLHKLKFKEFMLQYTKYLINLINHKL